MTSIEDEGATIVSQQTPTVVTQILTEPVDVSQMGGQSLADFIAEHGNMDEIGESQDTQETQETVGDEVAVAEATAEIAPPPTKKRKRMAFANKSY